MSREMIAWNRADNSFLIGVGLGHALKKVKKKKKVILVGYPPLPQGKEWNGTYAAKAKKKSQAFRKKWLEEHMRSVKKGD